MREQQSTRREEGVCNWMWESAERTARSWVHEATALQLCTVCWCCRINSHRNKHNLWLFSADDKSMRSPLLPLGGSRRFLSTTEAAMKIIPCASLYSLCRMLISLFTAKVHSFYFHSGIVHVSLISIYYGFPPPSDSVFFLPPVL